MVEHTNALNRAVVENQLVETSNTGRSNLLGGGQTTLDRGVAENPSSLLQEGPRREQFGKIISLKTARPLHSR
jgi:hypothetical protein